MLYTKMAPVGVDIPIQKLQVYLHEKLNEKWGLQGTDYQAHGRCYRNQKDAGYVAEVYTGNNEYEEVYLDDRIAAKSFFGLSGDIDYRIANKADVHLIYFVNIARLKPTLAHRGDEEVRKDVQILVDSGYLGFDLTGIRLGIDSVFQEYRGTIQAAAENLNSIKFRDMHPFHCFRFDFTLNYNVKQC